ncbi:MAG: DUF547 domain-containing protein [Flavobacteriaceae bacterium]
MKSFIYLLTFLFAISVNAQKNIHYRWNKMLLKYVSEKGVVNYKEWIQEKDNLDAYIKTLEGMPPRDTGSKNQKLAYWINAYNALTVQLILNHYPLKSIKEIKSPWDTKCFTSSGKNYTLGDIEHKILRKMDEPRIHFAINCASASCPKLLNTAFQEKEMEKQLVEATKAFLKDRTKNKINPDHIELSRIFIWFAKDFGSKTERLAFIERYSGVSLKKPKTDYLAYDWSLNE